MRRFLVILISLVAAVSCETVHQWPEPGREVDPTLVEATVNIYCDTDLDTWKIVTKGGSAPVYFDKDADKYLRRFTVEIYEQEQSGDSLVFSNIFYQEVKNMDKLSFKTNLHTRRYRTAVWMDYVLKDRKEDLHYITSGGLSSIRIRPVETYAGSDEFKDAQSVLYPFDLTTQTEWFARVTIDIPLRRPVAKITFIGIDFEKFAKMAGCPPEHYEDFAKEYEIHFIYNGYLPSGFNVLTQKLNDSQLGYRFVSDCKWMKDTPNALLGFDYVFVNGEESAVTVAVEVIRKKDGALINRFDGITVPTNRGKETIVSDEFFTKKNFPGTGIKPEFDGEYNIYV